jgi:UrcA family protein
MGWRSLGLSVAIAVMLASAAVAQSQAQERSVSVSRADIDPANAEDMNRLEQRLDQAARHVCGGSPRFDQDYRLARAHVVEQFERCRKAAFEAALESARVGRDATTPAFVASR